MRSGTSEMTSHTPGKRTRQCPRTGARLIGALTLLCVALAVQASASVTLVSYPQELVSLTDVVEIEWEEEVRCYLAYGSAPGAYTSRTDAESVGELSFVPLEESIEPGVHFCVLRTGGGGDSEEFLLFVESPLVPEPTGPPNGSIVEETTVVLEWDPVDGVPYYQVVVSDREIEIAEEEGEIRLYGANVIWQAITSATSIQYGSPDPSGHFNASNGVSPPLMNGFEYNWLVLNNYGNHPLLTSTAGAGIAGFTADVPTQVDAPELLDPPEQCSSAEEVLTFDWSDVQDAAGYHVYIHEKRDWAGGEASYPAWNAPTTASEIDVHLGGLLPAGEYYWRVVALDEAGCGACPAPHRLDYETATGEARIVTRNESGDALPWVFIEIEFASGGVEVVPAITNEDGVYNKSLMPGDYLFRATKEGHVDTLVQATIEVDQTTTVEMSLRRSPARIRGVVENELGDPIFDALVTATRGSVVKSSRTDSDGNFLLAVTPGEWTLVARKQGHESSEPVTLNVAPGEYHSIATPLIVRGTPGTLSGSVQNSSGLALPGATVTAQREAEEHSTTTGAGGGFTLELSPGLWHASAWKSGFQESPEREVEIAPGSDSALDPPIALSPVAASVSGRVTNGVNPVSGARVIAVPRFGQACETTTNGYGEFVLLPDPGDYELSAHAQGYAPTYPFLVSIDSEASFTGVGLVLDPLESLVTGRVTDGAEPVASATVTNGTISASTDNEGSFELSLPSGVHELRARRASYFSGPMRRIATAPQQTLDGLELRASEGAGSIAGLVACDGAPVPGAWIRAQGAGRTATATTGLDGRFELAVEAGLWSLRGGKDGFSTSEADTLCLADGQSASGIEIEIEDRSGTLRGSVSDARGPVKRASVLAYVSDSKEPAYVTCSNSAGAYTMRVAPDLPYTLRVSAPRKGTVDVDVPELAPGENRQVNVALPLCEGLLHGLSTSSGEPVRGAEVTAVWGDSAAATTDRLGRFSLWLNDGIYDVRIDRAGYETFWYHEVEIVSGEDAWLSPDLTSLHGSVSGVVVDSLGRSPVEGALIASTWPDGGASWITGSDGQYALSEVVPGDRMIRCVAPGYRSWETELSLGPAEDVVLVVELSPLEGTIAGTVRLDSGEGLPGASVRALLGGEVVSSVQSGSDGSFTMGGLDAGALYELRAGIDGYYCASANPITDVPAGTTDVSFTMSECTGLLSGVVLDGASEDPLPGVAIAADDGEGHFGQTLTDEQGAFVLTDLVPGRDYVLTASLFGYHDASLEAPSGSHDIDLRLARNFARLGGTVTAAGSGVAPSDAEVIATSTSYAGASTVAFPDSAGLYEVSDIRPGTYLITVCAPGCFATPAQSGVELGEGEVVVGLDFTIETAVIEEVEIGGPSSAAAGGTAIFTADAVDPEDHVVATDLVWSVTPTAAGYMSRASGRLSVSEDYIGEATVVATEPASGKTGSIRIAVYATVGPATEATFADSTGMSLSVVPGAVDQTESIFLTHRPIPDSKRVRAAFSVAPASYCLKPSSLRFGEGHEPELELPAASGSFEIVLWNEDRLEWDRMETLSTPDGLAVEIETLGEYALASDSAPLGIADISVEPNPFSPSDGAARIGYDLTSSDARMPFVTVRVYNMAAQLVRAITENEPQAKGRSSVEWDGLTDGGEAARNGRYVVEIRAEDASGDETEFTTIVLIK